MHKEKEAKAFKHRNVKRSNKKKHLSRNGSNKMQMAFKRANTRKVRENAVKTLQEFALLRVRQKNEI